MKTRYLREINGCYLIQGKVKRLLNIENGPAFKAKCMVMPGHIGIVVSTFEIKRQFLDFSYMG